MTILMPDDKLVALYNQGKTIRELARVFNCDCSTIRKHLKKLGLTPKLYRLQCIQCNQPFYSQFPRTGCCSKTCLLRHNAKLHMLYRQNQVETKPFFRQGEGLRAAIADVRKKLLKTPDNPILLRRYDALENARLALSKIVEDETGEKD